MSDATASVALLSELDLFQPDLFDVAETLRTFDLDLYFPPPADCATAVEDAKLLGAAVLVRTSAVRRLLVSHSQHAAQPHVPPATVSHDRSGRRLTVLFRSATGRSNTAVVLAISALYLPTNLSSLPTDHADRVLAQRVVRAAAAACDGALAAVVGGDLNERACGARVRLAADGTRVALQPSSGARPRRVHLEQDALVVDAGLRGDVAPYHGFTTYLYSHHDGERRGSRLDRVYSSLVQIGPTRVAADIHVNTADIGLPSDHELIVCDYELPRVHAAHGPRSRTAPRACAPASARPDRPARYSPANCTDLSLLDLSLAVAQNPELRPAPAASSASRTRSVLERDASEAQSQSDLDRVQGRVSHLVLTAAKHALPSIAEARHAQRVLAALTALVQHGTRLCERAARLAGLHAGGDARVSPAWKQASNRACLFALVTWKVLASSGRVPVLRRRLGNGAGGRRRRPTWEAGRWKVTDERASGLAVPFLRQVWTALSPLALAWTCEDPYGACQPGGSALRDHGRDTVHDGRPHQPSAQVRDTLHTLARNGRRASLQLASLVTFGAPPPPSPQVEAAKAPDRRRLADFWAGGVEARDDASRLITDPQAVVAELAGALATKFSHADPHGLVDVAMEPDLERPYACPGTPEERAALSRVYEREVLGDLSSAEVLELLERKQAKSDSAPGPSGLAFSLIRALVSPQRALRHLDALGELQPAGRDRDASSREALVEHAAHGVLGVITALLNAYLRVGNTSTHDKRTNILALAKKSTSRSTANVRPIALQEVTGKLLALALARRAERVLLRENLLEVSQRGFLANRRTGDCVAYVLCFLERAAALKLEASILLLDFRGAFDSPSRAYLRKCYKAVGFPQRLQDLLIAVNADTTASVYAAGACSQPFPVERGVPQGSPLSPLLWVLALNPLLRLLRLRREEAAVDHASVRDLPADGDHERGMSEACNATVDHAYADDLLLASVNGVRSLAETATLTARWARNTQCISVATDAGKHVALLARPRGAAPQDDGQASVDFQLNESSTLSVPLRPPNEAVRYLGVWFSADRSGAHEATRLTACVCMFLHRIRCLGPGGGPLSAAAFLRTHLFPVLEQSFQFANLEERVLRALDQRLLRAFRGRLDGFGGISKDWQRLLLRLPSFSSFYHLVRLCFVFHTLNEDSPASAALRAEAARASAASAAARPSPKSLWHGAKACADKLKLLLVPSSDRRAAPRAPHTGELNLTVVKLAHGAGQVQVARRPHILEPANAPRRTVRQHTPLSVTVFTDGSFDPASGRAASASIVLTDWMCANFATCAASPATARRTLQRGAECPFAGFCLHNVAVTDNVTAEAYAVLAALLSLPPCAGPLSVRIVTDSKTFMDAYSAFSKPHASARSRLRSPLRAVLLAIERWRSLRPPASTSLRLVHVTSHGNPSRSVEACGNALADAAAKTILAASARGGALAAGSAPAPMLGWLDGHFHVLTGPGHRLGAGKHVIGDLRSFIGREADVTAELAAVRRDSSQSSMARAAAGLQPILALAKIVRARLAPVTATALQAGGIRSLAAPTRADEKFLCFLATGRSASATTFCTWLRGDIEKMRKFVTEDARFRWLRGHLVPRGAAAASSTASRASGDESGGTAWSWNPQCLLCATAPNSVLHFVVCREMRSVWTDTLDVFLAAVGTTAAAQCARVPSAADVISTLGGAELCGIVQAKRLTDLVKRASRRPRAGGNQAGGGGTTPEPPPAQVRQVVRMLRYALVKAASQVSSRYRLLVSRRRPPQA